MGERTVEVDGVIYVVVPDNAPGLGSSYFALDGRYVLASNDLTDEQIAAVLRFGLDMWAEGQRTAKAIYGISPPGLPVADGGKGS